MPYHSLHVDEDADVEARIDVDRSGIHKYLPVKARQESEKSRRRSMSRVGVGAHALKEGWGD